MTEDMLQQILRIALPGRELQHIAPLTGGVRNANFQLTFHSGCPAVLRLYLHRPSLCRKEMDVMGVVRDLVPVPRVLHAEPDGLAGIPPFAILEYVEGATFRDFRRGRDEASLAQAAFSCGETLQKIGRIHFDKSGWLGPGPEVGAPLLEGANAMPRFIDQCLAAEALVRRVPPDLIAKLHDFAWKHADDFAAMESDTRLVHGDFNRGNLLIGCRDGTWQVAAVLDWEFAVSSSAFADFGNFLRYERDDDSVVTCSVAAGYRAAGGELPADWRRLSRLADLIAICESLTREHLPENAAPELAGAVALGIAERDPPSPPERRETL